MSLVRSLVFAVILVLTSTTGFGQKQILSKKYPEAGDTSIEVLGIFGSSARHGALPFRINIRNNSGRDRIWTLRFEEGYRGRKLRTEATFRFAVEDGKAVQHDVAFQFGPSFAAFDYRDLKVTVNSPGLDAITRNSGDQTNQEFPFLAMSKPLAQRSLSALDDAVAQQGSNNSYFAKPFEADALPTDWIGYTALDVLLLDRESWNDLREVQRQAVLSWVRLGGTLDIYATDEDIFEELKLPDGLEFGESDQSARYSLGQVRIRKWNGSTLQTNLVGRYRSHKPRSAELGTNYGNNWTLESELEEKDFDPVLIFILLLAFAIVVAPINLFVFAKSGRRHRLFITTPIISIVACIVIVAFIFLKDGLGGRGLRVVLADIQPGRGEMRLYTTQEQISRTGVMLTPGFESETKIALDPVKLPDSPFNPLSGQSRRTTVYDFSEGSFGGGFFRSRSEQGFSVQSTEPTRARVEMMEAGTGSTPPKLVSNLAFPVADFFYLGEGDLVWKSKPDKLISPGDEIRLLPATRVEFENWFDRNMKGYSKPLGERARPLRSDSNRFFTRPADPSALALPTHPAIDWDDFAALLTGTVVATFSMNDE